MATSFPYLTVAKHYQASYRHVLKWATAFEKLSDQELVDLVTYDMKLAPTERAVLWAVVGERKRREQVLLHAE